MTASPSPAAAEQAETTPEPPLAPEQPSGLNVQIQPALDVATEDDVDVEEFDPVEGDGLSNASTSIRSSILEHEYENGRRVCYL
jgi:hypothetical protein